MRACDPAAQEEEETGEEAPTDLKLGQTGEKEEGDETIGGAAGAAAGNGQTLRPQDVDAFWLQRQLSAYYPDAVTAQNMAKSVLEVLQVAKDARDCENKLVLLLDYDKFDLVKLLTKNWTTVLYCTRLGQAQSPADRAAIEKEMSEDPKLRPLLHGASARRRGWARREEDMVLIRAPGHCVGLCATAVCSADGQGRGGARRRQACR